MSTKEIEGKVKELRELKRMAAEMAEMIESLQDEIKATMAELGTDILTGTDWKITWKEYKSTRVDTTALKAELPELAERFSKTSFNKTFRLS